MLRNSKIINLATPVYIQFQNLFRIKHHFTKGYALPKKELLTVTPEQNGAYAYELLEPLYKSYNTDAYKNYMTFNNDTMYIYKDVLNAFKNNNLNITEGNGMQIYNDIRDTTHFERGIEDWNITHLVRKYKLNSVDVFSALVENAQPFNMGHFAYDVEKVPNFTSEFIEKLAAHAAKNEKYIHIDYWYGIGIKSSFPVDVHNNETPFKIAIRRYNDRNGGLGYERIIGMLNKAFGNRETNYHPQQSPCDSEEDKLYLTESKPTLPYNPKYDDDENMHIEPNKPREHETTTVSDNSETSLASIVRNTWYSDTEYIWKYSMEQKRQGYFNHRDLSYPDKPATWDYMMREFYNKYIKDVENRDVYLSLAHLFQFRDNTISGRQYYSSLNLDTNCEYCCSIVNMIIYGKVNVNWHVLERLLPLMRVKFVSKLTVQSVQIDNYEITDISYPGLEGPVYKIGWCDDNVSDELARPTTDLEKLWIAKALIRLMNEVPPELLNFNNYYHVCTWYHRNDLGIQTVSNI